MSAAIVPYEEKYLPFVKEIFFESSSKKEFKNEDERERFFYKYVGVYLKNFPQLVFVALGPGVLGYVVASPVSLHEELQNIQPHLSLFAREYLRFPAHLHINCHRDSRGKGIGSMLVAKIEETLKESNVQGLHIMTGADSENRSFYKKLGFNYELVEDFNGSKILLMGKNLREQ